MSDLDRRIERQGTAVAKLARQLQFERLILQRLRRRAVPLQRDSTAADPALMASVAEVYAAALLRQIEVDTLGMGDADPASKP